jgi:outer membrane receptor protein involved in Fe transport
MRPSGGGDTEMATTPLRAFDSASANLTKPARTRLATLIFFGVLMPSIAWASDPAPGTPDDIAALPLERLLDLEIYSASRFPQKASAAPSSARVITATEIHAHGWRTLAEALASLPGLFTSYDRTYAYLGARGFLRPGDYDSRFLLLVDGMRVNDPVYDQAPIGTDFVVDMQLVDRIEYVPGPGSAAFGSNAFFGVINVITRNGRDVPGAAATVQAGSFGDRGVSAQYGVSDGNRDLLLAATREHSDGATLYFPEFDTPETHNGIARGLDGLDLDRLLVKAHVGDVSFMLAHASQTKGDPTASYDQLFGDPRSKARDTRTLADLDFQGTLADDLKGSGHIYGGRYDYRGNYVDAPAPALNQDTADALWFGASVQAVYTGWTGHTFVVGFDAQRDVRRDLSNYDIDPYALYIDGKSTNTHLAPFVEDEFAIRDDLRLDVGLRYDHTSENGSDTSPRVALIYTPTADTTLKALAGEAYRAPNAYETIYAQTASAVGVGSSELDSERIRTLELVLSQRFGARTTLTASVFRYDIRSLIDEVVDIDTGDSGFENGGRVRDTGLELAIDHVWQNGATLRASYGYANVEDVTNGGAWFQNAPHHLVKIDFTAPLGASGLLAGAEARYVSKRLGMAGPIDPYAVVDLALTWPVAHDRLELALSLRNLFDTRYADPPGPSFVQNGIEQDGRTFLLRASYRF